MGDIAEFITDQMQAGGYHSSYDPDDYYGRVEGYVDYKAEKERLFTLFGIEIKGEIMQLAQVPVDGNKYDVVATITNLLDMGKAVGQKGSILQKFDLADASKAVKGVGFFYAGNQPDMAFPLNWNNQTMTITVSAKQNGQYTNYTASIPQGGAQFAGGNQAHAAPIANAMAANNVSYGGNPAVGSPMASQPVQQAPPVQQPYNIPPTSQPVHQTTTPPHSAITPTPDWDEIARGKVRCNLICALLQNSAYDSNMVEQTQQLADNYMNYIFSGQVGMAPPPFSDQIDYQG